MTECTKQQHTTNKEIKKYKIKHKTVSVKNNSLEFIIWSCTENLCDAARRADSTATACDCYFAPGEARRIAMSMSVCLSVSYSNSKTTRPNFAIFALVAVTRSCSGGVAIRHVLPVLWMTSCLHIVGPMARYVSSHSGNRIRNITADIPTEFCTLSAKNHQVLIVCCACTGSEVCCLQLSCLLRVGGWTDVDLCAWQGRRPSSAEYVNNSTSWCGSIENYSR